jgi:hypothetical protein
MNAAALLHRPIVVRAVISVLLGVAAAGLFFLNRMSLTGPEEHREQTEPHPAPRGTVAGEIDREVDSVLVHFGIDASWSRKKEIEIPNSQFVRIERRVLIPKDLATVVMNEAFNAMAKRFNGRAIASENLRENHVTIHIEVDGSVVETIILRPTANLRPGARNKSQTKV